MEYLADWQDPADELITVDTVTGTGSTVAVGEGVRESDGRRVTFAGDWRPMLQVAQAIEEGYLPVVQVPSWAILGYAPDDAA